MQGAQPRPDLPPLSLALSQLIDRVPHIVWTASASGHTTYVNGYCADYTGLPPEATYGDRWVRLVHPDEAQQALRAFHEAVERGEEYRNDYRLRRRDGAFRWHVFHCVPIRDHGGTIHTWIGTATEIEDQKQLEVSLRQSQRAAAEALTLVQSVEAALPVGVKLVDREFRIRHVNERLASINGLQVDDHIGRPVAEVTPHLWLQLKEVYHRALSGEPTFNLDVSSPSAAHGGRVRNWLATYYPVRVNGQISGVGNFLLDVTERREADEFRAVVMENMAEGLYALDANGLVTYVNTAASQLLGWTAAELHGRSMHELVHYERPDGTPIPARECELLRAGVDGRTVRNREDTFTRKDGTSLPVAYSSAPLRSSGEVSGVVVVFRDVTDERDERAATPGNLAASSWTARLRDALRGGALRADLTAGRTAR